jgi:O-acetyl-ADP-ribose deacetylase (regulator of RNase III)
MEGNPRGSEILAKYWPVPPNRYRYLAQADASVIKSIDRGILFLMAFWSGPSMQAMGKLFEVIARLDPTRELDVVIVDVDGGEELYHVPEFKDKVTAAGETAWIQGGKIVTTSGYGLHIDCFEPNTRDLLAMGRTSMPGQSRPKLTIEVVEGDLLDQEVDVIVNAWNRNIIPWWLLLPQGVSGAIKRRGGTAPFKAVGKLGPIPLGGAVVTTAGKLPFRAIIHVAGINMLWRASERSIRDSVQSALELASEQGYQSIAFPLIGAGSGSFKAQRAKEIMLDELQKIELPLRVVVVEFKK